MNISFKPLTADIVKNSDYATWINNKNINRFLEVRQNKQSMQDLLSYIEDVNNSEDDFLFGIFYNDKHIGNVKLYNFDVFHKFGEIGIVIGEPSLHNKGIGSQAIEFIKDFAQTNMQARKLISSLYSSNEASLHLFQKCKFEQVGKFKKHYKDKDTYVDKIYLEYHF